MTPVIALACLALALTIHFKFIRPLLRLTGVL